MSETEKFGKYTLYPAVQSIKFDSQNVRLKKKEFDLAYYLFKNQSRIISRAELWEKIWKKDEVRSTRTIDTHVGRLRKLLELTPEHGVALNSIHGIGYQLSFF
ncbi:MAG: response regulator transcription factor [Alphaproteobacteria bacterium]|nr:MAG: response regulator transcription factor [Alphaproteobacteria bacterium]